MTLDEYISIVFPILNEAHKNRKAKTKSHINYIASQIFYGVIELNEFSSKVLVSKKAKEKYDIVKQDNSELHNLKWVEQPKYDPKREFFIMEHIYTGRMFKNALDKIIELKEKDVVCILKDNYQVAWITKLENKSLKKSIRGCNVEEALKHYKEKEIELL